MRCLFLLLFSGLIATRSFGQASAPDSAFLATAIQHAIARYEESGNRKEQLFQGIEYVGYDPRLKGHPYFESNDWQIGSIQYNGQVFSSVPMLYDLVRDVVVIEHGTGYRMALHSDWVSSFTLQNHTFVRMPDSSPGLPAGFYDILYNGPTQLLAKRAKTAAINTTMNVGVGQFNVHTTYYIRKQGRYQSVKNRKTLLAALSDHKKQLAVYARKEKIKFKPDPEVAILKLTRHYDELTR